MSELIQTTRLTNGLTILTERMPGVRSVSFGIWVRRGSRHERAELNGICHFIEHSVFKGTRRRTARDIAFESDRLGGNLDAFTSADMTGFTMKVADMHFPQAFDLLADMLAQPRFDEDELKREQRVIIEEMKMVEDTPDEYLGEIFNAAFFPEHPLGRPIEGTEKTVSTFDHLTTEGFHRRAFAAPNLVIAAAGNIEHDALVEMARKAFDESYSAENSTDVVADENSHTRPLVAAPIIIERKRDLEQAHVILATPFPSAVESDRYAASLLGSLLGGCTSSRLWQSIREERGLAYSVGAGATTYEDVGVFSIYAGTSPEHLDEVVDLSLEEMRRVVREGVTAEELELFQAQAVCSILLSLESTSARASALARQEIIFGRHLAPEEVIKNLEAVTPEDIQRVAREFFTTDKIACAALGNLNGFKMNRARLTM